MNFHAIIFDLDGTLVETLDLYEQACIEAFAIVKIKMTRAEFAKLYQTGWTIPQWMAHYSIDAENETAIRKKRDDIYVQLLKKQTSWRQGAEPLLAYIKDKTKTGIVTGAFKRYVDAMNDHMKFDRYIDTIITADELAEKMKPNPYGLTLAANKMKVDPRRCLYVGDQQIDVEAANAAGMVSCLVRHTHTGPNAHLSAKLATDNLEDLVKILQSA
ncbi:MAG: HAD family hydrolase [Candidatus Peribacteraceae bacterium]|nr:HAD family hydrolase [Candidatus Peribacteraceae bacterium]